MFDIVSNSRNGLDVDKIDYILRDAINVGIKNIYFDHDLIFARMKVLQDQICFH